MTRALIGTTLVAIAGLPRTAAACATCISSGFGDRAYAWPYIGLILMPFVVAVAIVATLAWHAGWRPSEIAARISTWSAGLWHRRERGDLSPRTNTETT